MGGAHRRRSQLGAEAPNSQFMHLWGSLESGPEGWVLVSGCGTLVAPLGCISGWVSAGLDVAACSRSSGIKAQWVELIRSCSASCQSTARLCWGQPSAPALTHLLCPWCASCTSLTCVNVYLIKGFFYFSCSSLLNGTTAERKIQMQNLALFDLFTIHFLS